MACGLPCWGAWLPPGCRCRLTSDSATPWFRLPEEAEYPTILGMPAPRLRVYARETVVAEKLQAMVDLGMANSRMKDFYDLWFLSTTFEFERARLHAAISATFQRRGSAIPASLPVALTKTFADDASKRAQWSAFISRARVATLPSGCPT